MKFVCVTFDNRITTAAPKKTRAEGGSTRYIIRMLGLIAGAFCGLAVTTAHAADEVLRIPLAVGATAVHTVSSLIVSERGAGVGFFCV